MSKRVVKSINFIRRDAYRKGPKINFVINLILGLSFLVTAASGIHFLSRPRVAFGGQKLELGNDLFNQPGKLGFDSHLGMCHCDYCRLGSLCHPLALGREYNKARILVADLSLRSAVDLKEGEHEITLSSYSLRSYKDRLKMGKRI